MKNIIYTTLILLNLCLMVRCKKSEIPLFTDSRYIYFTYGVDPLEIPDYYKKTYSFGYDDESVEEAVVKIPVLFLGYNLSKNLTYSVVVDEKATTLPENCYVMNNNPEFKANIGNVDSLEVKLIRNKESLQQTKVLKLLLTSNENFKAILQDSLFVEIYVDDIFGKPQWWDLIVEKSYLGTYSETKYWAFRDLTGVVDFGALASDQKRYYALMFKRDLEANPRSDENGPMSVPIVG